MIYALWKWRYYGDLLPNTYYAKEGTGFHADLGLAYLETFIQSCPAALVVSLCIVLGLSTARDERASFLRYVAISAVLYCLYALKVGGDFMEYRFMWEAWPLFVCGGAVGLRTFVRERPIPAFVAAALAMATTQVQPVLEKRFGMQELFQMDGYARLSLDVGSALGRALPPNMMLSTTLAGVGYFMPQVSVIDQWGLNDRFISHIKLKNVIEVPGFNGRGHLKYAPLNYLISRGVNLFMDHPAVCDCNNLCHENKPDVFVRLGHDNQCVRTWYLTQTPELTRWFCSHPEFVLDNVDCGGVTQ
jgi:hypothetical protein